MAVEHTELINPIRVVMFSSGPRLIQGVKKFLHRLESHPEIELLGAFCQAESQSFWAVGKDLWQRRGFLALPLMLAWIANSIWRFLVQPRTEIQINRRLDEMSDRIVFIPDIHAEEVLNQVRALEPDLGLIYGSPILKPELFEIPTFGSLGIHHGKLPDYRGNKTTFWAIYNGEKTAGVTIQKVNAGLDTGQIVKSGEVIIGRRSQRAVWRELEALGLDLYVQAILDVKQDEATYQPQVGPKRKLYRNPKFGDFLVYWWRQIIRVLGRS